ncbi:hypothetical protein ACWDTI_22000 [Gordonia sp. NPDC003424]
MSEQRKAAINAAYDIAAEVADGNPAADLDLVASSLDTAHAAATRKRTAEDVDRLVTDGVFSAFGFVDRDGPLWAVQRDVAVKVLQLLTPDELTETMREVRWADATDAPEPWDGPVPSLPAPSAPLPGEQGVAHPDTPATPDGPSETNGDNTEHDGSPAAESTDDDPEVIIDAEVIEEVGQTTSSQTRYRMPTGQVYAPRADGFARRIGGGGRPVTQINTDSPHLGDQR